MPNAVHDMVLTAKFLRPNKFDEMAEEASSSNKKCNALGADVEGEDLDRVSNSQRTSVRGKPRKWSCVIE